MTTRIRELIVGNLWVFAQSLVSLNQRCYACGLSFETRPINVFLNSSFLIFLLVLLFVGYIRFLGISMSFRCIYFMD
jgi:hypothetical protein